MEANWTTGGRWMTNWFEPDEEGYGIEDGGKQVRRLWRSYKKIDKWTIYIKELEK